MPFTIIALLLQLFPVVLKNIPGISTKLQQIISDVTASVAAVLGSGAITEPSVTTIAAAWQGVVEALQNDPTIPPAALAQVNQLEKIIQAVMLQDAKLAASVDWTAFHPITPVP